MTRTLATLAVLVAAAVLATAATAATPTPLERSLLRQVAALTKQEKTLTREVTVMQKQVTTLQKQATTDETALKQLATGLEVSIALTFCSTAVTSDQMIGLYGVVDQLAQPVLQKPFFGPQTPLDDGGACQAFGIARAQTVPPSLAQFSAVLALLHQ
jgi:hypothetical protein